MRRFAQDTTVSVEKSRSEIEAMLTRYGATSLMSGSNQIESVVGFEMKDRKIMFRLPLPDRKRFTKDGRGTLRPADKIAQAWEQACRSSWRALALSVKAKLEAVEIGITTFEDEFLAHIVMPDGMTVSQHVRPRIASAYESGQVVPLLPGPKQ
jgi:hypothetical protein